MATTWLTLAKRKHRMLCVNYVKVQTCNVPLVIVNDHLTVSNEVVC